MKVGIRYCGGCNPTYARESIEKMLREIFSNDSIVHTSDCRDVDILVVICGCKTACTLREVEDCSNVILIDEPKTPAQLRKLLGKNFSP